MKKTDVLKVVNPILGILLLNQILTGLLADMLPREVFGVLHQGGGIAFAVLAVLHLILNWNWIKANYFQKPSAIKS